LLVADALAAGFFPDFLVAAALALAEALEPVTACRCNMFAKFGVETSYHGTFLAVPRLAVEIVFFAGAGFLPARVFLGAAAVFAFDADTDLGTGLAALVSVRLFAEAGVAFALDATFLAVADLVVVALVVAVFAGRALVMDLDAGAFAGLFCQWYCHQGQTSRAMKVHGPPWRQMYQQACCSWVGVSPAPMVLR